MTEALNSTGSKISCSLEGVLPFASPSNLPAYYQVELTPSLFVLESQIGVKSIEFYYDGRYQHEAEII